MSNHDAIARRRQLESLHDKPLAVRESDRRGDFIKGEDGFWYYAPCGDGTIPSYQLRQIADELDARNHAEQQAIDEYFAGFARGADGGASS